MIKAKGGFTLIELLLSLVISVVVGGLLLVILVNSSGLYYKESSKVEQGLSSNDGLASVNNAVKQASSVAPNYPTTSPFTYTSGATQLILKVPSTDNLGNIIPSTYDYFVFFQDQTKLRFKVFPDSTSYRKSSDQILALNVNSVVFKYLDGANLEVSPSNAAKINTTLILKQKSGQNYETSSVTSETNLRND